MDFQLKQLRRGVHAVVGTPGRIQDHLRRKTLKLDKLASRRHRRGRRDAADGLHRGRREHLGRDARAEAGGALLRDVAGSHSQGRRAPPQRSRRGEDQDEDGHGRGRRPAVRRGARLRQARGADAHPRGRGFRRDADLRPHAPGDGGAQREARSARARQRGAERRDDAGAARTHDRTAEERQARHRRRDRRRGARARRRARHPRRQLRRSARRRGLHPSHRPHGPSRPSRARDPVRDAARTAHAGGDRARDAPARGAHALAEPRGRRLSAFGAVQGQHHRGFGLAGSRVLRAARRELRRGARPGAARRSRPRSPISRRRIGRSCRRRRPSRAASNSRSGLRCEADRRGREAERRRPGRATSGAPSRRARRLRARPLPHRGRPRARRAARQHRRRDRQRGRHGRRPHRPHRDLRQPLDRRSAGRHAEGHLRSACARRGCADNSYRSV